MADGPASDPPTDEGVGSDSQTADFYRGGQVVSPSNNRQIEGFESKRFRDTVRLTSITVLAGGIVGAFLVSTSIGKLLGGGPTGLATGIVTGFVAFPTFLWAVSSRLRPDRADRPEP